MDKRVTPLFNPPSPVAMNQSKLNLWNKQHRNTVEVVVISCDDQKQKITQPPEEHLLAVSAYNTDKMS
jgi:hypothetical protein